MFFLSKAPRVLQNLDTLVLATFIYIRSSKCPTNLTQNHASISTVFHTQFKNAKLFFLLGINKERLKSNTEMVVIFKLSDTIIECMIAVCIFLLVFL